MKEIPKYKRSEIVKSIVVGAMLLVLSIFFILPYITKHFTEQSIAIHIKNNIKQLQQIQDFYKNKIIEDTSKNPSKQQSKLPSSEVFIDDLIKIFNQNSGVTYHIYRDVFSNDSKNSLSLQQREYLNELKLSQEGIDVRYEHINEHNVLRVSVLNYASHNTEVIEAIVPIDFELNANDQLRYFLVIFILLVSALILYYLLGVVQELEKALSYIAHEFESEASTLYDLLNEYAIISRTDLRGVITYVSKEFCRLSGYTKEELLEKKHNILRHPEESNIVYKTIWETIKADKVWSGDIQNRSKDGTSYYVHTTIFPVFDSTKRKIGYASIYTDITQRVLSQKALDVTRKLNQIITDNQQSILVMSNVQEGVVSFNQKFYDTFPFENFEDFKKQHNCICELFIEKEGYLFSHHIKGEWTQIVLNNPQILHKTLMHNKEGEERIYSVMVKEVALEDKISYVSTLTDITEIEHARELAELAVRSKSEFMANMSHELRTPLNGITGFTELLSKTTLDQRQSKYVTIISSSVANLLNIINDILDFSKIQSGKLQPDFHPINPFIDFREALQLFQVATDEKNIFYTIMIHSKLAECLIADKLRLTQILYNLIGNAVKFTNGGGEIEVSIAPLETQSKEEIQIVRFGVKDTGIGIPKEKQKKVFEVFSQADTSTTRQYGGTGLGLSISASLVEILGGRLHLESKEGKGSYFYFDLPLSVCVNEKYLPIGKLETQPIYVVNHLFSDVELVIRQLEQFKVTHYLIEENQIENHFASIFILFDKKIIEKYKDKMYRIVLIHQEGADLSFPPHVYHINKFQSCPSELYNAIVDLHMIKIEGVEEIEDENLDLKILVAEDHITNQILLEELLEKYHITPTFVENGEEAVIKAKDGFDIILMDINMPIMNGIEATQKIRQNGNTIPIIALTANALEGDRERLLDVGMDDYLSKPINIKNLYEVLKRYAKNKRK